MKHIIFWKAHSAPEPWQRSHRIAIVGISISACSLLLALTNQLHPWRGGDANSVSTHQIVEGSRTAIASVPLFGRLNVSADLKGIDPLALDLNLPMKEGDTVDLRKINDAVVSLSEAVAEQGYAFVNVRPDVKLDYAHNIVNVGFTVGEGPRIFVEHIDIIN